MLEFALGALIFFLGVITGAALIQLRDRSDNIYIESEDGDE